MNQERKAIRYVFDRMLRSGAMWVVNRFTIRTRETKANLHRENIKTILVVRGLFRMGDSILATPAILLMRQNFPAATIDFVGPPITKSLFQKLPIGRYYEVHRQFPKVCWSYLKLLADIRQRKYDLAFDASGSSAALGSFIVGFSGARFRVGIRGKWDRWFNIRVARPASVSKYTSLPDLFASLGLKNPNVLPKIILSRGKAAEGKKRVDALVDGSGPIVGIFVGGRKSRGKRWPIANFVELATVLYAHGARPVVFVGPEEIESQEDLQSAFTYPIPVVFEPDIIGFAALVANCQVFVSCDSGPVHVACALRVRTVAIFLKDNFDRWGPPDELGRIVFRQSSVDVVTVFEACLAELNKPRRRRSDRDINEVGLRDEKF